MLAGYLEWAGQVTCAEVPQLSQLGLCEKLPFQVSVSSFHGCILFLSNCLASNYREIQYNQPLVGVKSCVGSPDGDFRGILRLPPLSLDSVASQLLQQSLAEIPCHTCGAARQKRAKVPAEVQSAGEQRILHF